MKSISVTADIDKEIPGQEAEVVDDIDLEEGGLKEMKSKKKKKRKKNKSSKKTTGREGAALLNEFSTNDIVSNRADYAAGPPTNSDTKNRASLESNESRINPLSQQIVKQPENSDETFSKISHLRLKLKEIEEDRGRFRHPNPSGLSSSSLKAAPNLPFSEQDLSSYHSSDNAGSGKDPLQQSRKSKFSDFSSDRKQAAHKTTPPPFQLKTPPPESKDNYLHSPKDHDEDERKHCAVQASGKQDSIPHSSVPNSAFSPSSKKIRSNSAAESYDTASLVAPPLSERLSEKDSKNYFSGPILETAAENYAAPSKKSPLTLESAAENYDIAPELEEGKSRNAIYLREGSPKIERREICRSIMSSTKSQISNPSIDSQLGAFSISTRVSGDRPAAEFGIDRNGNDFDNLDEDTGISMESSGMSGTGNGDDIERSQEFLVEAEAVDEAEKVYATATPDPWWRRNQAWLAAVALLLLAAVLVSLNLGGPSTPTAAPTTVEEGIQESIRDLVLSQYPQTTFEEQTSAQSQAVQWVADMKQSNRDWYTDERILLQYSLVKLFLSTSNGGKDNSSWYKHGGWMESKNECEWYGIECDSFGVILNLQLPENNLDGELQPELAVLSTKLSAIDLSNNNLVGIIPEEMGKLLALKDLDLSNNAITGSISSSIGGATKLEKVNLSNNILNSIIPTSIGRLSKLESIDVGGNDLIGSIPSEIGALKSIKDINCQKNRLTYELPSEIGNLVSLEKLNLQNNDLLGPLPSEMGLLKALQHLDLSENHIFYQIPVDFYRKGALASLESLDLSNNLLTGMLYDGEKQLHDFGGSWKKLRTLRLQGNYFKDTLPLTSADLYSIPELEVLDLSSNYLTGPIPAGVLKLSTLTFLDLSDNQFEGQLPEFLMGLNGLNVLNLGKNKFRGTLSSDIGKLSALGILDLSNSGISGSLASELGSLSLLKSLHLCHNSEMRGTLPTEIGRLTRLESLDFANIMMNGTLPTELGELVNLEYMDLSLNRLSGSIPSEYGSLTALIGLRMGTNLLKSNIPDVFANFTRLQDLNLSENKLYGSFPDFIEKLSLLSNLNLGGNILTGAIPSELGLLSSLTSLSLYSNSLTGSIPSEIGYLKLLESVSLTGNAISGLIPSEIANLVALVGLSLSSTKLSGSIPGPLCDNVPTPNIWVDCEQVSCSCPSCSYCQDPEIPSEAPSVESVDSPDPLPSMSPTAIRSACSSFKSIRESGSLLDTSNEPEIQIDLPFSFNWGGNTGFRNVTIDQFSGITMGDITRDRGECYKGISPGLLLTEFGPPQAITGTIYYFASEKSVIISWEGVKADDGSNDPYFLNFQVALNQDGSFELRWGEGAYSNIYKILAGATDTCDDNARAGATGAPFQFGITGNGLWPIQQCRSFQPNNDGFYTEKRI